MVLKKTKEKKQTKLENFRKKRMTNSQIFYFFTLHFRAVSSFPIASHVNELLA